jgi:hypothetical protein
MTHQTDEHDLAGRSHRDFLTLCLTAAESALDSGSADDQSRALATILASARHLAAASHAAHRRAFTSELARSRRA